MDTQENPAEIRRLADQLSRLATRISQVYGHMWSTPAARSDADKKLAELIDSAGSLLTLATKKPTTAKPGGLRIVSER